MLLNRVLSAVVCLVLVGCYGGYSERSQVIVGADAGSGGPLGDASIAEDAIDADAGSGGPPGDASIAEDATVVADADVTDAGVCPSCSEDGTCSAGGGGGDAGVCTTCEPYTQAPPEEEEEILSELVAQAIAVEAALQNGDNPSELSDTTNGCTQNLPQLPAGCIVYRGNARWLYCWMNGYTTPVGCLTACGVNASCPLTDAQINTLATTCGAAATSNARALCVIDGIRGIIGGWGAGGNVCRHFARCFKRIYEAMGLNQSVTTRWFGVFPPKGHTFNLVPTTGGGQYYADASNNILFWCP